MITTAVAVGVTGLVAASEYEGEFELGFLAPMVVDIASLYTAGAIAGVFPVP